VRARPRALVIAHMRTCMELNGGRSPIPSGPAPARTQHTWMAIMCIIHYHEGHDLSYEGCLSSKIIV
jgi:hypothetical protein